MICIQVLSIVATVLLSLALAAEAENQAQLFNTNIESPAAGSENEGKFSLDFQNILPKVDVSSSGVAVDVPPFFERSSTSPETGSPVTVAVNTTGATTSTDPKKPETSAGTSSTQSAETPKKPKSTESHEHGSKGLSGKSEDESPNGSESNEEAGSESEPESDPESGSESRSPSGTSGETESETDPETESGTYGEPTNWKSYPYGASNYSSTNHKHGRQNRTNPVMDEPGVSELTSTSTKPSSPPTSTTSPPDQGADKGTKKSKGEPVTNQARQVSFGGLLGVLAFIATMA